MDIPAWPMYAGFCTLIFGSIALFGPGVKAIGFAGIACVFFALNYFRWLDGDTIKLQLREIIRLLRKD